ncbi:hypothetical protein LI036_03780 [bacterium 210917-DFI.7.65]|nr:hypothetical protein [bacterium 210917-DFI.7.65]
MRSRPSGGNLFGTERSIAKHLSYHGRDKRFCPPNRKLTARGQHVVCGQGGEEILLKEAATATACRCIDRMIEFG